MGAIREALRMIEAADAPHRPCDQERHEADGGKGQCVHLRDGKRSACGRADAPDVFGNLVDVAVCGSQHGETFADSYHHQIGFTSDPQWVSCLACRDKMHPTTLDQLQSWLLAHRHEHHSQWVALLGESLVASNESRKALQAVVNAHPDARRILVSFVGPIK